MNYSDYTKKTKKKMKAIETYLEDTYGEVHPEWAATLYLLADNLDLYDSCLETLSKTPLVDETGFKKNPLLSTIKDIQGVICKLSQQLGITPWASSKIKLNNWVEDDSDEYLDYLTGNGAE